MIFRNLLKHRSGSGMDDAGRVALEPLIVEQRQLPARHTLVRTGEPMGYSTYLIDGFICRYMDDRQGYRQLVALQVPGDFVDLHGYPLGRLDHDVATLTPCKIALAPHPRLDRLLETRPDLTRSLWFATLLDAAMHREWVFRLGRLGAAARLAHLFAETEMRLRAVGLSDGQRFAFPLTQMDMAEACGLTPVHVNRMLRTLRANGLLRVENRVVDILDLPKLWKFAEFDPEYLFVDPALASTRTEGLS